MGKVQQEIDAIIAHLADAGHISLSEAMNLLDVSDSTARRLFTAIAAKGLADRVHGGLKRSAAVRSEYTYETHQALHASEKEAMAAFAARLVENNDSIFLDWGTTASYVSEALARRLKAGELHNITVFTNALTNVQLLHPCCEVISLGGRYREERRDFAGYLAEETLKRLHFKKCFLCADGFSSAMGFTTYDFESARADELILQNSTRSYILMDSSKYTRAATANCTGDAIPDALITNAAPPPDMQAAVNRFVRQIFVCPISPTAK